MRALLKFVVSAVLLAFATGPAPAVETGSAAWTVVPLLMFEGPGGQYNIVGEAPGQIIVRVDTCSRQWCLIRTGFHRGWVDLYKLSFGRLPYPWPIPYYLPATGYGEGGPGYICLFEGLNYTGEYLCGRQGLDIRDLLLYDLDHRFRSVWVEGNVSVTLCRDRDFKSYCDRVNESRPKLSGFLDEHVTSVHVH